MCCCMLQRVVEAYEADKQDLLQECSVLRKALQSLEVSQAGGGAACCAGPRPHLCACTCNPVQCYCGASCSRADGEGF